MTRCMVVKRRYRRLPAEFQDLQAKSLDHEAAQLHRRSIYNWDPAIFNLLPVEYIALRRRLRPHPELYADLTLARQRMHQHRSAQRRRRHLRRLRHPRLLRR
ncbi:uncharacterized protein MONBRDRAFT_11323 [Monosiga brevicollis MX1]|uniref:Uncharacterized protein n=1 Tax=Monosiga brevicollis TaxID=81824 RepID=A9V8W5_MONBE|nr:uncharacterized protein MONBRDRAFT_11323 [Monosiga brevicollis MX1]EDQ85945.1 predicted protein [Monosiga brevicollis MX1]|eukprot:XP_001749139.1 hypothetical protein [Monosiga brevicollis MX1]